MKWEQRSCSGTLPVSKMRCFNRAIALWMYEADLHFIGIICSLSVSSRQGLRTVQGPEVQLPGLNTFYSVWPLAPDVFIRIYLCTNLTWKPWGLQIGYLKMLKLRFSILLQDVISEVFLYQSIFITIMLPLPRFWYILNFWHLNFRMIKYVMRNCFSCVIFFSFWCYLLSEDGF